LKHFISEIRNFFEDYKKLEKKTVVVEEFLGKKIALEILEESFKLYDMHFRK
jgi:inorganic pyrophosphatase